MTSIRAFLDYKPDTANASTYTFSGLSFGAADPDRYLVAVVAFRSGNSGITINSLTIGGVTASHVVTSSSADSLETRSAIYIAKVPSGTSGSVVMTLSGTAARAGVSLYSLTGIASATPAYTNSGSGSPVAFNFSLTHDGHAIAGQFEGVTSASLSTASADLNSGSNSVTATQTTGQTDWTGLSEDIDFVLESSVGGSQYTIIAVWDKVAASSTGTIAVQESGSDTFAGSGVVGVSAALSVAESGADSMSAVGLVLIQGGLSVTESGADVFAGIGGQGVRRATVARQITQRQFTRPRTEVAYRPRQISAGRR